MKYTISMTINNSKTEQQKQKVENDAQLAGIALAELLEKHPRASSFVITVVPTGS